jgi:biotin carboxyl carrier protein
MTNAPTKKFRASLDDASFDAEVAGDVVRVERADAVSSQSRSNDQPRQAYTQPSSTKQSVEPASGATIAGADAGPGGTTGVTTGVTTSVATEAATIAATLDRSQFVVTPRGPTLDVRNAATAPDGSGDFARAIVAVAGDVTWVSIDGEVFTIDIEDAQRMRRPRAAAGEGLSAPMPATVIKVLAEPGREVKRGETLLLLEAMKMELPVRAPRDGKVKALHCQAGQLVQPGVPLVDLE